MLPKRALKELCELIVDCPHSTPVWTNLGVIVLRNQNIRNGRLLLDSPSYTDEEHYRNRTKRAVPRAGDIVITREAPMGEVCMIPTGVRCCLGQRMVLLRPDSSLCDNGYLLYALQSKAVQHEILVNEGTGSTVSNLRIPLLEKLPIPIRPLPEQRTIASILGSLDDKIELNRRMNETLEEIARALFKSWFVAFDPVRAKMDGRQPAGMSPEIAKLFPSEFEHVNGELVPKGWSFSVLDDMTELVVGGDWGKESADGDFTERVLCIRGADIPSLQSGGLGKMPVRYIKKSSVQKRSLQDGDLVFEISGGSPTQSTGRPVLATKRFLQRLSMPVTCSNFCRLIRPVSQVSSYFLYCMLRTMYEAGEFLQYENGTTGIKNLAFTTFSSLHTFVRSTVEVMQAFDNVVAPLYEHLAHVGVEAETLATVRGTLLPKLLSGELRVPEADKILEEVL